MTTAPKFGGSTNKCHVCNKTAYEMEACTYDKMIFHKTCFKCLNCKKGVSISGVAMIQGKLYCKTCFVKMFKQRGKYDVFGEETLPKAQRGASGSVATDAASSASSSSASSASSSSSASSASSSSASASTEKAADEGTKKEEASSEGASSSSEGASASGGEAASPASDAAAEVTSPASDS